jgi:hypothetical protein
VNADEPVWLLGFFTGRRHAVRDLRTTLTFRGVPLAWSVCGAPVVIETHDARGSYCPACVRHAGLTTWARLAYRDA